MGGPPRARVPGRAVGHDATCRHASGGGTELGTQEAVNALMRDGARACTDCDTTAVLVPALPTMSGHA
ncbi:DUF6233 domain-containing protein [Streptomyces sp. NPDC048279]|uniref:DUF6233 domain-containing protein n=1 Tax=Streptomyces sp. NPDC048279 TaxID=3154714 RepID=UPI00344683D0